jgi:hypothetical protein
MRKISAYFLIILGVTSCLSLAQAEVNPFKKTKDMVFADNVAWYFKFGAAIKSGSEAEAGDTLYYHLIISKDQLMLRLGKNDPSGELENTRPLDAMEIRDVMVDGQRLPQFQWCLDNQAQINTVLKQNAVVANDECSNANSDFAILINDESRNAIAKSRSIEFVIAPYGRPIRLSYSMGGFAKGYADIIKPEPPKVVAPAPVVEAPKPRPPEPVVIKTCTAVVPEIYQAVVKPITYPCADKEKQAAAEARIKSQVDAEKQKRLAAEAERKRLEEEKMKEEQSRKSKETDFEKQQSEMWISRCKKHWEQGKSPCYCAPYMDQAPAGVVNTCEK